MVWFGLVWFVTAWGMVGLVGLDCWFGLVFLVCFGVVWVWLFVVFVGCFGWPACRCVCEVMCPRVSAFVCLCVNSTPVLLCI